MLPTRRTAQLQITGCVVGRVTGGSCSVRGRGTTETNSCETAGDSRVGVVADLEKFGDAEESSNEKIEVNELQETAANSRVAAGEPTTLIVSHISRGAEKVDLENNEILCCRTFTAQQLARNGIESAMCSHNGELSPEEYQVWIG